MGEAAALIGAITALLGLVLLGVVLYRPPKILKSLRWKGVEAEFDTESKDTLTDQDGETQPLAEGVQAESPAEDQDEEGPAEDGEDGMGWFSAARRGDYEAAVELLDLPDGLTSRQEAERLAIVQALAAESGSLQALENLKRAYGQHPDESEVQTWYGFVLSRIGDPKEALQLYRDVRARDASDGNVAWCTQQIAGILIREGDVEDAFTEIQGALKDVEARGSRAILFGTLAKVYLSFDPPNEPLSLAAREMRAYLAGDRDAKFNLAYKCSESGEPGMALHHYRRLLLSNPDDSTAANNAGVAAANLGLKSIGVEYYKRAETHQSTLASANLAYLLINGGFLDEAETRLRGAQEEEDVHRNVLEALGAIARTSKEEEDKDAKIADRAKEISQLRRRIATASLESPADYTAISGLYEDGSVSVSLEVADNGTAKGTIQRGSKKYSLSGRFYGAVLQYHWRATDEDEGILRVLSSSGTGTLIVTAEQLHGYSIDGSDDPSTAINWETLNLQRT